MARTRKTRKAKAPSSRITRTATVPKAPALDSRAPPRGRRNPARRSTPRLPNNARPSISVESPSPTVELSTSSPALTQDDIFRIVDAVIRGMPGNPPAALTDGDEFDMATTSFEDQLAPTTLLDQPPVLDQIPPPSGLSHIHTAQLTNNGSNQQPNHPFASDGTPTHYFVEAALPAIPAKLVEKLNQENPLN